MVSRSAWRVRLPGRLSRALVAVFVVAMTAAGVRSTLAQSELAPPATRAPEDIDQEAEAFAEGFARLYLTWDPAQPELHERAVARYLSDELDPSAGIEPSRTQEVRWTTVMGVHRSGTRELVTIAADAGGATYHLEVPVERDEDGLLAVVGYPALVGPPPVARERPASDEDEVSDPLLRGVCERALRNYLAGDRDDLLADLDLNAVVSLPDHQLELKTFHELTRVGPGKVAAQVEASGDGAVWTLRYELDVVKRDRWYLRAISSTPRPTTNRRSR